MKKYICLIILLCSINCFGHDEELQKDFDFIRKGHLEKNDEFSENYEYTKYDSNYEDYIGNPDIDAKIERPCHVYDLNCIRKFFAEHSKCKIRRGPLPRDLFISQETLYYTRVNTSVTSSNFRINGFRNSRIEEFYINRRTNKMVFSIQMRAYTKTFPTVYFVIYRNGREPIVVLTESMDFWYQSVTFTAIIPYKDDLQLEKAEITAYSDAIPGFVIGPDVLNSTDPIVARTLAEFLTDLQTNTQEIIFTDSYLFVPAYIQFNICDFGLTNL